jgi:hypothetical protein
MKQCKSTEYGTRKAYCKCNCCGYNKGNFVIPFTDYFEGVNQRCPICEDKFFYFTLNTSMKYNIQNNLK